MNKYFYRIMSAILLLFFASSVRAERIPNLVPEINIGDTRVVEGNSGKRQAQVMVFLSQPATERVTVNYDMKKGTATENEDFIPSKGTITFQPGEMVKWINVDIVGDAICETDKDFGITLSSPQNATIKKGNGKITIVNDDCNFPAVKKFAAYEVRFTHTGYTTFLGTPADCPIRPDGKVVLYGILSGSEADAGSDDIQYTGTLQLDIDMDICSVERLPNGEDRVCGMRVTGSGSVDVTLDIYYDGRGGYVKLQKNNHSFFSNVAGGCKDQIDEEKTMVPDKTIATCFNGTELPELVASTLQIARYVHDEGAGNVTIVEVLRKIK
jgi:hypothetical protein